VPLFTDIQSQQTINSVMAVKVIRVSEYSAAIKREIALSTVITGQSKQNSSYQLRRYCSRTARQTSHSRDCSDNDENKKRINNIVKPEVYVNNICITSQATNSVSITSKHRLMPFGTIMVNYYKNHTK
jgi:hypothetical protein